MELFSIFLFIIILLIVAFAAYKIGRNKTSSIQKINNDHLLEERRNIKQSISEYRQRVEEIESEYQSKKQLIQDASDKAEQAYKLKTDQLEKIYRDLEKKLKYDYECNYESYMNSIEQLNNELKSIQNTKAATIEAIQKEEAIKQQVDQYRLNISETDIEDVKFLESIKTRISKPRLISMLIWQSYYQPLAKEKFPVILGSKEICGIYKITNQIDSKCYIGQAKNIRDRWNNHCKCGLGIDTPQGNKLYQAMLKYGLYNFTFELLETCLPEELDTKEAYYIKLYNSVDFGYNSNQGKINGPSNNSK